MSSVFPGRGVNKMVMTLFFGYISGVDFEDMLNLPISQRFGSEDN